MLSKLRILSAKDEASKKLCPDQPDRSAPERSSLRIGALPKPEKVRELPLDKENKAAKHAADQNSSLAPDGKRVQNVVPSGKHFPTAVSSGN